MVPSMGPFWYLTTLVGQGLGAKPGSAQLVILEILNILRFKISSECSK